MKNLIDTDKFSAKLRGKAIDLEGKRILISRIEGSEQEEDLTVPPNCSGYGRVRHFRRSSGASNWPSNPLPIDPVASALGLGVTEVLRAQVFQNAVCNWRCWYCYVPYSLLAGDKTKAAFLSASQLVELYQAEPDRPKLIDLSGGQPDLTPEWVPWMMEALGEAGLKTETYLWSDDNLSNDYFWRYLSVKEIDLVASYENYSRVCCFKGYNQASFSFNTGAAPEKFENQFELMRRFHSLGMDLYAYATFTTLDVSNIESNMATFVNKLQEIHENLPLRLVPLEIFPFGPVSARAKRTDVDLAIRNQMIAIEVWKAELSARFPKVALECPIHLVRI